MAPPAPLSSLDQIRRRRSACGLSSFALDRDDLAARDLRVLPTGMLPHGDIVSILTTGQPDGDAGDLDALIAAARAVRHHVEDNPHYRGGEGTS